MPESSDSLDCSLPDSSVHGFSRQEYWSGLQFPAPGHLPNPGIKPRSPTLQADSLPSELPGELHLKVDYVLFFIILAKKKKTKQNKNKKLASPSNVTATQGDMIFFYFNVEMKNVVGFKPGRPRIAQSCT